MLFVFRFDQQSSRIKNEYETRFLRYLEKLAADMDRKCVFIAVLLFVSLLCFCFLSFDRVLHTCRIKHGQERLEKNYSGIPISAEEKKAKEERVGKLNDNIKALLQQMEQLGEEGKVGLFLFLCVGVYLCVLCLC